MASIDDPSREPFQIVLTYLGEGHTDAEKQALHRCERAYKQALQELKAYKAKPMPDQRAAKEKKWQRDAEAIPRLEAAISEARRAYIAEIESMIAARRQALPSDAQDLIIRSSEPGMSQTDPYAIYYTSPTGDEILVAGFSKREDAEGRRAWWWKEIDRRNAATSSISP